MKFVPVDTPCPMCHESGGLAMLTNEMDVPYFGAALETTLRCTLCGFKHSDFMILGQKEPLHIAFRAEGLDDLSVRVIRSNSGTLRIPELGFLAEPTPLSESYVSNVEGVLERAKDILLKAAQLHEGDEAKQELLRKLLEEWELMRNGQIPFTIEIDDPFGNSAIASDRIEKRALTDDEVAHLKTGYVVIDADEL